MKSVDLKELEKHLVKYVEEAARGAKFLVTMGDFPAALLEPPPQTLEGKVPIPEAGTGEIAGYFDPDTGKMKSPGSKKARRPGRIRRSPRRRAA